MKITILKALSMKLRRKRPSKTERTNLLKNQQKITTEEILPTDLIKILDFIAHMMTAIIIIVRYWP